jgi:hypothetical protein
MDDLQPCGNPEDIHSSLSDDDDSYVNDTPNDLPVSPINFKIGDLNDIFEGEPFTAGVLDDRRLIFSRRVAIWTQKSRDLSRKWTVNARRSECCSRLQAARLGFSWRPEDTGAKMTANWLGSLLTSCSC